MGKSYFSTAKHLPNSKIFHNTPALKDLKYPKVPNIPITQKFQKVYKYQNALFSI